MRVHQHSKPPKGGKSVEKPLLITQHNVEGEKPWRKEGGEAWCTIKKNIYICCFLNA